MTHETTSSPARSGWTYWVAYGHASGRLGAVAVSMDAAVVAADQVVALAERIGNDAGVRDVTVLSWQVLSAPTTEQPAEPSGRAAEALAQLDSAVSTPGVSSERAELLRGLAELAEFLAAHPQVPVDQIRAGYCAYGGDDVAQMADVDAVCAELGVTAALNDAGQYVAERYFGPVKFDVFAVTEQSRRRWEAEHSYRGNIVAEQPSGGDL